MLDYQNSFTGDFIEAGSELSLGSGSASVEHSLGDIRQVASSEMLVKLPDPVFHNCTIVGPDGIKREAWEMWIGERCFGKSDSKALLIASYDRLKIPENKNFHWRQTRMSYGAARKSGRGAKKTARLTGGMQADFSSALAE